MVFFIEKKAYTESSQIWQEGFCAETGGGVILTVMAWFGIHVSTAHSICGAIMSAGATKRLSAVRWGLGKRMVYAWIITIPAAAAISGLVSYYYKNDNK
jgi:inorganic phosphate transporter, PiT family